MLGAERSHFPPSIFVIPPVPKEITPVMALVPVGLLPPRSVRFRFEPVIAAALLKVAEALLETVIEASALNVIGPLIVGTAVGAPGAVIFGTGFVAFAAGDLLVLFLLRKEPHDVLVQDHPTRWAAP